jgi:hypothetical protein
VCSHAAIIMASPTAACDYSLPTWHAPLQSDDGAALCAERGISI